ncbi:hypothetical protein KAH43_08115 [Candidatus Bipolaricaulota bacterium]|nr:hypothetical protein [Candidatus Bipolaricaulota bacterium]
MSGWLELQGRAEKQYRESLPERGFFKTATNGHFRILDDGKSIFYPQGAYGRSGFAVSSTEQELLLRRNAREYRKGVSIAYFIVSVAFAGFFQRMEFWQHMTWIAGFVALNWIVARIYFRRFTRKMEPAEVPNSPIVQWRSMGQTMHPLLLILEIVGLCFFAGAALYSAVKLTEPSLLLFGALLVAGLGPFVIALRSWWSKRSE